MEKFKNIWSIEKNGGDSDIDIIKNNNGKISIYKKYYTTINQEIIDNPTFLLKDIKKYHKIQNNTKLFKKELKFEPPITLLGNKINTIIVDILKLDEENILHASDLKTKTRVIITNPPYVKGTTFNEYLKNLEYQKSKEIKEKIVQNIDSDKLYYEYNGGSFKLSQISTFNIKVTKIENSKMYLLITDIAQKIKEIVK